MIVLEGQTILDISIQEFGSPEYVAKICKDNDVGINDDLTGLDLTINSTGLGNEKVKEFILLNKLKPNNKFESTLEIINFVRENGDNAIFEDAENHITE